MDEKTHLIQQLDEARAKMRAVLVDIDLRMEIYPGWTIKHVLAYLSGKPLQSGFQLEVQSAVFPSR